MRYGVISNGTSFTYCRRYISLHNTLPHGDPKLCLELHISLRLLRYGQYGAVSPIVGGPHWIWPP